MVVDIFYLVPKGLNFRHFGLLLDCYMILILWNVAAGSNIELKLKNIVGMFVLV